MMTPRRSCRWQHDGAWCASIERPHLHAGVIALCILAAAAITASVMSLLAM